MIAIPPFLLNLFRTFFISLLCRLSISFLEYLNSHIGRSEGKSYLGSTITLISLLSNIILPCFRGFFYRDFQLVISERAPHFISIATGRTTDVGKVLIEDVKPRKSATTVSDRK